MKQTRRRSEAVDEIRKAIRQNAGLIITAVIFILITVTVVFIFQFLQLREAHRAVSASLVPAAVSGNGSGFPRREPLGESPWSLHLPELKGEAGVELVKQMLNCPVLANQAGANQAGGELVLSSGPLEGEAGEVTTAEWRLDGVLPVGSAAPRRSLLEPGGQIPLPEAELRVRFLPRLALIIDDWGYDWSMADEFLSLGLPFTAAVLPGREKTREQAELLRQLGHEVILHLPMEPLDPDIELDDGFITTNLDDVEIRRRIEDALASVGEVAGVNNHMGSKATSDERVVRIVLEVIQEHGLYFVDSWTSPASIAGRIAGEMGIPTATNQVFLDHYSDVEKVKAQIERLIRRAQRDGQALGIGHVRPQTYRALVEMLPRFQEAGVVVVPASSIVSPSLPSQD
ncbi:MAG: divergent polysaccharide deacetylase family protein [Firmicutes bacterium]|nr:divergent polysaccharide deacetylase family protein [Bacillota bacterium]